jgi:hypothetical protein
MESTALQVAQVPRQVLYCQFYKKIKTPLKDAIKAAIAKTMATTLEIIG